MQYFRHLLGEISATGARTEDRLMYNESGFDEDNALDLIARHIIDQDAGAAFFANRMRMQRDLLSDGVDEDCAKLVATSRHRRPMRHRTGKTGIWMDDDDDD